MKSIYIIKLKLELCDRNRNFGEILESIYNVIKERDGVDGFEILEENDKEGGGNELEKNKL